MALATASSRLETGSMKLHFAFFSFGPNAQVHSQVCYAILSTMAHCSVDAEWLVVTDRADFYQWLKPHIRVLPCSTEQFQQWQGPQKFFWRSKIEAIRYAAAQIDGHLLYLDSDIVAKTSLDTLKTGLDAGHCYMHCFESVLRSTRSTTGSRMWKAARYQSFGGLEMDDQASMWNAGVIAIPQAQLSLLDQVLASCDDMLKVPMPTKLIEQYSFSRVLQSSGRLQAASDWFDHYWGNKPGWNAEINTILAEALLRQMSVEEAVEKVRQTTIELPVYVRDPWLKRTGDKLRRHLTGKRR